MRFEYPCGCVYWVSARFNYGGDKKALPYVLGAGTIELCDNHRLEVLQELMIELEDNKKSELRREQEKIDRLAGAMMK